MALSKRQAGMLAFIRTFVDEHQFPPTIREIGKAVGITSTSVVNYNLNVLEEKGHIARDRNVSRGLRLIEAEIASAQTAPLDARARDASQGLRLVREGTRGSPRVLNIPLLGRIVAVADAYDAMTSDRSYRKALPHDIAIAELERCSGSQFDPRIVEVFLHAIEDFRKVQIAAAQ